MPPRPKYTREEIIQAAFDIACRRGIEAVAAREVGKQLGTSSSPIFTFFSGMDELKNEVRSKALSMLLDYLNGVLDYRPAFKEFGLRWIRFAIDNPNLYRMLFRPENRPEELSLLKDPVLFEPVFKPITAEAACSFGLSDSEAAELMNQMLIHANGIAGFCLQNRELFSLEQISRSLSEVCIGLVISAKIRDGSFDPELAAKMAASAAVPSFPKRIR